MVNFEKQFLDELNLVRNNLDLLDQYKFDTHADDSKHFDRLRLNIAIYNDFRASDFEIAKFLFQQEMAWRKCDTYYQGDENIDNLYFSAFVLTKFEKPEIVIDFCKTKNIDMDSGSGFDSLYFLAAGMEKTYQFLESVDTRYKEDIFFDVGDSIENCYFDQEELDEWKVYKTKYFEKYQFPIQDLMWFLYQTNQKVLFSEQFKIWINSQTVWNEDNSQEYLTFARYLNDQNHLMNALKFMIQYSQHDFLVEIYQKELNELI